MQIFKELGELIAALRATGVEGTEELQAEANEIIADATRAGERRAMHDLHGFLGDILRAVINGEAGTANYLFGTETAGKVRIVEHCTNAGPSASIRAEANVGTHDLLITVSRLPKAGSGMREGMHIGRVVDALERMEQRREMNAGALRAAADGRVNGILGGMRPEITATLESDAETYALVSECLEFMRRMFEKETENSPVE